MFHLTVFPFVIITFILKVLDCIPVHHTLISAIVNHNDHTLYATGLVNSRLDILT